MTREKVRFWHYADNGPVLITIKAGQSLSHYSGGSTDEGWHSESHKWDFDGEFLRHETVNDGRDCDGRLTRFYESMCHASQVAAGYGESDNGAVIVYPAWQAVDSSQIDEYAEAMGY